MEPIFAKTTLEHTIGNVILRIRIRAIAGAVQAGKVVIVLVVLVHASFLFEYKRIKIIDENMFK